MKKNNKQMNNAKNIKISKTSDNEDSNIVIKFIIIMVSLVLIIGLVYIGTELIKKDSEGEAENTNENTNVEIDYDKIYVGTLLNRDYDEYYVMAYKSDGTKAILYSTILTNYMYKEKHTKIYFCDLADKLNSDYYNVGDDNVSNPEATKINDLDFGEITLLQVKKGKITKYIEDLEEIKNILK